MDDRSVGQKRQKRIGLHLLAAAADGQFQQVASHARAAAAEHMARLVGHVHNVIVLERAFHAAHAYRQKRAAVANQGVARSPVDRDGAAR